VNEILDADEQPAKKVALGTSQRIADPGREIVVVAAAPDFRVGQARVDRQFGEGRTDVRDSSWPPQRQELRVARDVEECLCLSDQLVRGSPRVIRVIVGRVVRLGAARPLTTAWRAYTATGCRLRAARCGTRRAPPGGKLASA
jgi:hypothetical protein